MNITIPVFSWYIPLGITLFWILSTALVAWLEDGGGPIPIQVFTMLTFFVGAGATFASWATWILLKLFT